MWYLGGKIRLSKRIVPIIENFIVDDNQLFIDLFCGGCNIVDKINSTNNKIANDNNEYLIEMWKNINKIDLSNLDYSRQFYYNVRDNKQSYEKWLVGFIGFHYSYGGKFFGGYAKSRYENHIETSCKKTIEQYSNLKNVTFTNLDYTAYTDVKNAVIYCDPPYANVTQKSTKYNSEFNHNEFWEWCRKMSQNNVVIISEKTAPNDFDIIWSYEHNSNMSFNKSDKTSEKLFIFNKERKV